MWHLHSPQPHPHLRHAGRGGEGHPAPGISSTPATPASAPCWERKRGSSCSRYIIHHSHPRICAMLGEEERVILLQVYHPALGQSSCSSSVILLLVSHPAPGQSSCSRSVFLLLVSHPTPGQSSCSRSVILLLVSHPTPGQSSCSWSTILIQVSHPPPGQSS